MSEVLTGWPEPLALDQDEDILGFGGRAVFNEARTHRYLLIRRWGPGPLLTLVMLNPSKAGAFINDPTVLRCIGFARRHGYGGIQILNLFALRATDPAKLRTHMDPVGLCNDRFITEHAVGAVVAAWGAHQFAAGRAAEVAAGLAAAGVRLLCLGVTKDGHPRHPLYVRATAPLVAWEPP